MVIAAKEEGILASMQIQNTAIIYVRLSVMSLFCAVS